MTEGLRMTGRMERKKRTKRNDEYGAPKGERGSLTFLAGDYGLIAIVFILLYATLPP